MAAVFEHVNLTVPDPEATAALLVELFDWRIRWQGPAMAGGYTVHVGDDAGYLALYRPADPDRLLPANDERAKSMTGALNHVAVVVDNLDETEKRIHALGFSTENHADYAPGRRYYFYDHDGIEYEVVAYS